MCVGGGLYRYTDLLLLLIIITYYSAWLTSTDGGVSITKPSYLKQLTKVTETISCACCTTVEELLLAYCFTLLRYCYHPLCLRLLFKRRLSFYLFHYCYIHHLGRYYLLCRRFLIAEINVALQLIKESYYYYYYYYYYYSV